MKSAGMKKWSLLFLAAFMIIGLVAGCGSTGEENASSGKVLRVAGEVTYPPFEFSDEGKYKGFDVDLANAIGEKIGEKVEYVSMGFDALVPALESHQIDAVISGLVITPEREKRILFSTPYWKDYNVVVIRKDETNITSKASLANKTIGAQIATTGVQFIEQIPGAKAKQFDTITTMLQDLQQGTIQAAIVNGPVANYYIQKGGLSDLKTINVGFPTADLGIGINKQNKELQEKINKALAELKADGTYEKLVKKWFGEQIAQEQTQMNK